MALSGNIALKTSAISAPELYEKWDMAVFKAHRISALCWYFVNVNLVNRFPCVVGILFYSMCLSPASWMNDVDGSRFPELNNPGVVSDLAPKKWHSSLMFLS